MGIQSYTSVAASNTLFPENMLPSAVNDNMRTVQADLKTWYADSEWQRQEEAPSRASATTFKITGDVTTKYLVNRKVRVNDASTYYGTVTASSYGAPDTTVTVELESGSLTASLTAVAIAALAPTNLSIPPIVYNGKAVYAADGGASDAYAITLSPVPTSYVTGMIIRFKANTANTGAATLNVNSLGAKTIKKNASSDLIDNDIVANQIVEVVYDGTNFQMLSTLPASAPFIDSTAIIKGSGDATKLLRIEVDGLTTATTRVLTMADQDVDLTPATQAQMETGSATNVFVTPGRQQFHPGMAKFWINFNGTGTIATRTSYNVTSITDNGVGDYTVTIATDFSTTDWCPWVMAQVTDAANNNDLQARPKPTGTVSDSKTAGDIRIFITRTSTSTTAVDSGFVYVGGFGDQ
jgi:hypothetical protein